MTDLDHTELRRKAEAATQGEWAWTGEWSSYAEALLTRDGRVLDAVTLADSAQIEAKPQDHAYIAAANPATILALLDEIDALKAAQAGVIENLQAIFDADWRNWQELASPHEFVAWAKRRSAHALCIIEAATKEKAS